MEVATFVRFCVCRRPSSSCCERNAAAAMDLPTASNTPPTQILALPSGPTSKITLNQSILKRHLTNDLHVSPTFCPNFSFIEQRFLRKNPKKCKITNDGKLGVVPDKLIAKRCLRSDNRWYTVC